MKKVAVLFFTLIYIGVFAQEKNRTTCWTLIHNGQDIYNGQYNNNEFPGYHDPETTDLEEVTGGFLTTGQYNRQTFDSNDNNIYTNLEDKDGSYLTKHNYNGDLEWVVYTEKDANSYRDVMFGSVEDSQGNIYVIGYSFNGTFYDSEGTTTTFSYTSGFSSGFIVKLDSDGRLLWHITVDNVFSKKITIDEEDNILLSGDISIYNNFQFNYYFNGVITDNLSNYQTMGNDSNYVNRGVLKINPQGELLWYTSIKTSGPNSEFLIDIGSDNNNNVYVTGYCSFNAEVYSAGTTENPEIISWTGNPPKTFLIKFDKDGQIQWQVKSRLNDSEINGVQAWSTIVDEQGNSYITGYNDRWRGDIDQIFENSDGSTTSENVGTYFIAKVNTNGICEWIKGAAHSYSGTGYKVIKSGDEIIAIGSIRGFDVTTVEVDFLSSNGNNVTTSLNISDYFIAVYDTDGNINRLFSNGINDERFFYTDRISGFFKDANNNYYMSRNLGFYINGPEEYNNFGHIINAQDMNGIDATITKFTETCGVPVGSFINQNVSNLALCDNTSVGNDEDGLVEFDLTIKEAEMILSDEPLSNYEFSYYSDPSLNVLINNPDQYVNTSPVETVYVLANHLTDPDQSGQTSFVIEVKELPTVNASVSLNQCDDDLDGLSLFNLTEANQMISFNHQNESITFHESLLEAENASNAISNILSYSNEIASTDKIWARVENNDSCFRIAEVNLIVSTTQIPNTFLREFYQCDDGNTISDGIATFNFSAADDEIRSLFPSNQQLATSYHTSLSDALSELNPIDDISNYQNTEQPYSQEIYVRVESLVDNSCLGLGHHITLHVESMPVAYPIQIPQECDIDRDGFVSFNTSNIESSILNGQTGFTIKYLDEYGNELPSPLPNPFITATTTITAQVINLNSQDPDGACSDETTFDFVVIDVPLANPIPNQEACDTDFDNSTSFDTSTIESTLLGNQTGMIVEYFDGNGLSLPSPLPNPFITYSQTITARITNPQFDGCYDETYFDFIVNEKPTVELQDVYTLCITENPQLEITIENINNELSYEWTNDLGEVVSSNPTAIIEQGGNYFITATSQFGCSSEVKEIFVDESALALFTDADISLINDDFNNSIIINTDNLGIGDYEFALLDANENPIIDYQDNPIFNQLEGGTYTVAIRDKKGCGIITREISFITFPQFFTPNDDGVNDTWKPKGFTTSLYRNGTVEIFNRFGSRVATFSLQYNGWNGNYEGKKLPSNDYWYLVKLVDNGGNERVYKGHVSLIRR
jgi:gliding motility-associated-like protein